MMELNALSRSGPMVGMKVASAGAFGHEFQGVLAADIAAGFVGDGHDHNGVDDGVGQLRRFQRLVDVDLADGIAAIGDDHDYLASLAGFQPLGAEVYGIVHGGSGLAMEQLQAGIERL